MMFAISKRAVALAAALMLFGSVVRAEERTPLTLADAVAVAVERNFDLRLARIERATADADAAIAHAGYDPTLALGANATERRSPNTSALSRQTINTTKATTGELSLGGQAITGAEYTVAATATRSESDSTLTALDPQYDVAYSLSVAQPLLKNAWNTPAGWRIVTAERLSEAARFGLENGVAAIVTAVHAAYWDLAYRDGALAAQREALARAGDFLERVEVQVEVGSLAPIQSIAAKATVAESERLLIEAVTARDKAEDALLKLVNPPTESPLWEGVVPADDPVAAPVALDAEKSVDLALERRPDLKQAEMLALRAEADRDFYDNQTLPDLSLVGAVTTTGVRGDAREVVDFLTGETSRSPFGGSMSDAAGDAGRGDYYEWQAGVKLSVPLGNRAPRAAALKAELAAEARATELARLRRDVTMEAKEAVRDLKSGLIRVEAAKAARELAAARLEAEMTRFEVGAAPSFSVLEYQRDLTLQRSQELAALASYRTLLAAYHRAVGESLETNGIRFEESLD